MRQTLRAGGVGYLVVKWTCILVMVIIALMVVQVMLQAAPSRHSRFEKKLGSVPEPIGRLAIPGSERK